MIGHAEMILGFPVGFPLLLDWKTEGAPKAM
jgi:hypothetical protein